MIWARLNDDPRRIFGCPADDAKGTTERTAAIHSIPPPMPDRSEFVVAITRPLLVSVIFRVRSLSRFRHDQPRVSGEHNAPQLLNFFFRSLNSQLQYVCHVIHRRGIPYLTIYYRRAAKRARN